MRYFALAVLSLAGCAPSQGTPEARAPEPVAVATPEPAAPRGETGAHEVSAPRAAAASDATADPSDQVFVLNARRAIAEYRQFLARAGDAPEYADAAQRSRERIADLEQMIVFVEQGRDRPASQDLR